MKIKKNKVVIRLNGRKARIKLSKTQTAYLKKKFNVSNIEDLDENIIKLLKEKLMSIKDVLQTHKKCYKLWDILMYVILASFSNVESWYDIHDFVVIHQPWLKQFLKMTGGIPTRQTIERVMSLINPKELENVLTNFFIMITNLNTNEKTKPLNSLNAYSNNYGICLASEQIDEKTNEIPTIPNILNRFSIEDVIITWDALNTQTKNVEAVINGHADYVVPIKANQENFFNDLKLYFDDKRLETIIAGNTYSSYLKQIEKSHSFAITYEYFQRSDIDWYFDIYIWVGLRTIGVVKKTIEKVNETVIEFRYYISSLDTDILLFSKAIRNHWSVENKLHWHLDFTFREDNNTTANKNALFNFQSVNKFCLGV